MDIRFINEAGNIINATNLSINRSGNFLIGMNDRGNQIVIQDYENKEEAIEEIKRVTKIIENEVLTESENVLIDLRKKEEEK